MSSREPHSHQHGGICCLQQESVTVLSSKQSGEKTAPERAGAKQLYDLCPDVMEPYCLLSLSNGSHRTADFIPHGPSLLLQPPSRKQGCDNEGEEVGKCLSFGFSFVIPPMQIRAQIRASEQPKTLYGVIRALTFSLAYQMSAVLFHSFFICIPSYHYRFF